MKNPLALNVLAIIVFLMLSGCSNSNDLIKGQWLMDSYFVNGVGQEQDRGVTLKWTFLEDGTFRQLREHQLGREELKGTWTIDENTNSLLMFYPSTQVEVLWTVVKLEKDLLEVSHTTPGFFVERGFKRHR